MASAVIRRGAAVLAALLTMALVGCAAPTGGPEPEKVHAVTAEEAQLLAMARFRSFAVGSRPFTTSVQERGVDLRLQGWVDYASHLGFASVTGSFPSQALLWTPSSIGVLTQQPDDEGNPVLPVPSMKDPALSVDNLDPATSRLDSLLAVISSLGADRPDNSLLLQQSGALWLRTDVVGDSPVTVFAAPPSDARRDASSPPLDADTSPLRLWVDEHGLILRAEARIGDDWSTIDFPDAAGPDLQLPGESR